MKMELEEVLPSQIEARSFAIIAEELAERGIVLDPEKDPIIRRCIHTTADFEYAERLVFSEQAVELGKQALKRGAHIVTDTNMGWSGVNKKALEKLGGQAYCFMADADVAERAKENGTTRAVASVDKMARLYGSGGEREGTPLIFAVGNAPTALVRLYELINERKIAPALVIGVPVGFVNVVQSKEWIISLPNTPFIVARGRKGGSNVAACICNALLYACGARM